MERKTITALKCVARPRRWSGSVLGKIGEAARASTAINRVFPKSRFLGYIFFADSMTPNIKHFDNIVLLAPKLMISAK